MAATFTPNAVAREASTPKHPVTAKMVRGWARANMPRFSKATHPARQSHEYTAAERTRIVAAFKARANGGTSPTPRKARKATPRKATVAAPSAE